jgi:hypothetical protein
MENNQHSKGERNTSGKEATRFTNEQPGQQLPSNRGAEKTNEESINLKEQHSESSMPEKENETLGTP